MSKGPLHFHSPALATRSTSARVLGIRPCPDIPFVSRTNHSALRRMPRWLSRTSVPVMSMGHATICT